MVRRAEPPLVAELGPGDRRRTDRAIAALLAGLAAYNVARSTIIDGDVDVVTNIAVGVLVLVVAARAGGLTVGEIGLRPGDVRAGLRVGLVGAAIVATLVVAAAVAVELVTSSGGALDDDRARVSFGAMLLRVVVVIPIATAAVEEVIFRGVLHGLLRRRADVVPAAVVGSLLFAAWHLFPAWHDYDDPAGAFDAGRLALIAGTFVATFVAGLVFVWLRHRSGHLVAPMLCHATLNSVTFASAWVVTR